MQNGYYRLVLQDMISGIHYTSDTFDCPGRKLCKFDTNTKINYNSFGLIISVDYYSSENELKKRIYYDGEKICKKAYYQSSKISVEEVYDDDKIIKKNIFDKFGKQIYSYEFEYNTLGSITKITKFYLSNKAELEYKYDQLNRIIERKLYLKEERLLTQNYTYDVLNRIMGYKDDNQSIMVYKISNKNELINYEITDKMGHKSVIENYFSDSKYYQTKIILNGNDFIVKDTGYLDNIMLKKPYAAEDDLDLLISNLYNASNNPSQLEKATVKSENIIMQNIETKVLPISIRKRLLYSIASQCV